MSLDVGVSLVTTLVVVWIEMSLITLKKLSDEVTTLVVVWIEISCFAIERYYTVSHHSRSGVD